MSAPAIGSLFSGSGMLDEAVRSVIGGTVVWHAEHEPATEKNPKPTQAAARVLAYRYPDVPNIGDISAVDWSAVPRVDVLTGGFPCQDVSHAGKRAGLTKTTRSGLWARMCDAIDVLRPRLVVIENVRGLTSACADSEMEPCPRCVGGAGPHDPVLRALGRVLGDLAELGYDAQWHGLPASDVGAPHGRFRIFIVASDATGARGRRIVAHDVADDRCPPYGCRQAEPRRRVSGAVASDSGNRAGDGQRPRQELGQGDLAVANADRSRPEVVGPLADGTQLTDAFGTAEAAAHTDRDAVRQQPVAERRSSGEAIAGLDREATPDPESVTRRRGDRDSLQPWRGMRHDRARAGNDATLADTDSLRCESVGRLDTERRDTHRRDSADIAWGDYEPAIRRWEALTRPAPAPTERGARGGQRLSRWFDEWMMGWPDGWVTDVPGITYREAVKICGNGVVPQQAAAALRMMLAARAAA